MINAAIVLTHLRLVFLTSIFDMRRYDRACLTCAYGPCPVRSTAFFDESVEKNKSVSSKHGVLIYGFIYFVIICFSFR